MTLMTFLKSVVTVDCTLAPRAGKKVFVWLCTATVSVCVLAYEIGINGSGRWEIWQVSGARKGGGLHLQAQRRTDPQGQSFMYSVKLYISFTPDTA